MNNNRPAMQGLLLDLDGTLYHGVKRIEGADRLIAFLREIEMPYRFVTNNSTAAPETVAKRLNDMGIAAEAEEVITSAQAASRYIASLAPNASVYMIGEEGLKSALLEAGLRLTEEHPDFVVQGIDRNATYSSIATAVRHIRDGARYVLTNPDLLLPSDNGLIPGAGSIGAMIRAAGGQEPVVIGKPSAIIMNEALRQLGLTASETWVVGDNLATDIAAGITTGCGTLLVMTGLTTRDNYEHYASAAGCKPDLICDTLDDVIRTVKEWQAAPLRLHRDREE